MRDMEIVNGMFAKPTTPPPTPTIMRMPMVLQRPLTNTAN
jgi:hypothetical protein